MFVAKLCRQAVLVIGLFLLSGCQGGQSTSAQADDTSGTKPLPQTVSLFGIHIGMTPGEINKVFPGAHCAPMAKPPTCHIPSTALGSSSIEVEFTNNKVSFARTEGEVTDGRRAVSKVIVEQLGPPNQDFATDSNVWTAMDGSELTLSGDYRTVDSIISGSTKIYEPAFYLMTLSSPGSREQHARQQDLAQREAIAGLLNSLEQFLAIEGNGRISACGISVGDEFNRPLNCSPAAHAKLLSDSRFGDCASMLGYMPEIVPPGPSRPKIKEPAARTCVKVTTDAATRRVTRVSATLPIAESEWITISRAIAALKNSGQLKLSDSLSNLPGVISSSREYENALGDVLTVEIEKDEVFLDNPWRRSKLLTVIVTGQPATKARFR